MVGRSAHASRCYRRLLYFGPVQALTVYEKPTCTTCRKLHALLTERGVDFQSGERALLARPVERVLELL
jgi:arsenate reductase (glutaredoxin)